MLKTKYYIGFRKMDKPFQSGFIEVWAETKNAAKHQLYEMFHEDSIWNKRLYSESEFKRIPLSEICDEPCTCIFEANIFEEIGLIRRVHIGHNINFDINEGILKGKLEERK